MKCAKNEEELAFLETEYIFPLKKKSTRFINAIYFCRLCDHHINTFDYAKEHIVNGNHINAKREKATAGLLAAIPRAAPSHVTALDAVIKDVAGRNGRSPAEYAIFDEIARVLTALAKSCLMNEECYVRIYGSCLSRFALKWSNLNLELMFPEDKINHALALIQMSSAISASKKLFTNVSSDFCSKYPHIKFNFRDASLYSDVTCVLSVRNKQAYQINRYLRVLSDAFPQLTTAAVIWRYWAKICKLDNPADGGLPAYAFDLMLIHYLQNAEPPLLPIVHKMMPNPTPPLNRESSKPETIEINQERPSDPEMRGDLDLDEQMLIESVERLLADDESEIIPGGCDGIAGDENRPLFCAKKLFDGCEDNPEQPQTVEEPNNGVPDDCQLLTDDQQQPNNEPELANSNAAVSFTDYEEDIEKVRALLGANDSAQQQQRWNYGQIFLGLLRYYVLTSDSQSSVVNIRQKEHLSRDSKNWNRKRLAIEDPFLPSKNLAQLSNDMYLYLTRCMQNSYKYFGVPRTESKELAINVVGTNNEGPPADETPRTSPAAEGDSNDVTQEKKLTVAALLSSQINGVVQQKLIMYDRETMLRFGRLICLELLPHRFRVESTGRTTEYSCDDTLNPEDYLFEFYPQRFLEGLLRPRIVCEICKKEDHVSTYCPDPLCQLGPLRKIKPVSKHFVELQNFFLSEICVHYSISKRRQFFQESFRQCLEKKLQEQLFPDAQLFLFGSSVNGFGFSCSDLDLCLTFRSYQSAPENLNFTKIIKQIVKLLRDDPAFSSILPVTKAKVPIVRFYHRLSKLEGDLSLYNVLALRNTHLLYCYSNIDQRAKILGYMVKVFAKYCDIGDASKGSLSSYAYVIMMIYFLQRCNPPVLPLLQQMGNVKNYIVDGWETYFYSDIDNLARVWKSTNKRSTAELWIEFLRFYTEYFDYRNEVIQIRRDKPLTKFEKSWTDRALAIEDPFELSHNLASGLSQKMFAYIIKVLRKGREVFGHKSFENQFYDRHRENFNLDVLEHYFFGTALKMDEPPPKGRVCKYCERVGHFVENCPMKRSNRRALAKLEADQDDSDDEKRPAADVAAAAAGGGTGPAAASGPKPKPGGTAESNPKPTNSRRRNGHKIPGPKNLSEATKKSSEAPKKSSEPKPPPVVLVSHRSIPV